MLPLEGGVWNDLSNDWNLGAIFEKGTETGDIPEPGSLLLVLTSIAPLAGLLRRRTS
ncbi:MAG: PEP-CTERM sorting domain-containing protein [Armatimonadetes bacterium]|nr:PEP-CTERM sorting domain-containing protein [Armatimonadota bacterium]